MNLIFNISLLYLFSLFPLYKNNPMPFIESWLKKDQNDGTVERDMTSSLTGRDESFGSAHQNYQNSLIRKKKCDDEMIDINSNKKKLSSKFDRNENFNQPDVSLNTKEINYVKYEEKNKNDPTFDELDETGDFNNNNNYHPKQIHSNVKNEDNMNRPFLNNLKNDKYIDIVPYKDILPNNRLTNSRGNKDLSFFNENYGKWSGNGDKMKELYSNNPNNYISRGNSLNGGNFMQNPMSDKDPSNNEYNTNDEPEGRNPQVETDYYDSETNPSITDNEFDEGNEYGDSFSGRSFLDKRDETAQQRSLQMNNNNKYRSPGNSQKAIYEALKVMNHRGPSYQTNQIPLSEFQKNPSYQRNSGPNYLWNVNSNFQSKALQDVLKNSQKALKEVQLYQQKHVPALRSDNNLNFDVSHEVKNFPMIQWSANNLRFDEKRLKREDEDEQKNMKTGTDEGGGGEYEDEEGKGHNDEEEYYEDADLSNNESGNEIHSADDDEVNKKLVKRELNTGEKSKKNSGRKGVKIWDQWGKWSPCSVTCGIGRSTRWRHCVGGGCAQGEKEAQIKRCTNPAC
ncbi:conserved hypothetical protein [Pediculus humanus corporis]|uniref:Uncharacterized protein n=1 Tax=Pediculus humanus subsp. corporis TaxID=121224 RepID=E0W0P3_PEDHC|nr:uncharacterized protein Phum_PHUM561150 [Pediculus humanus corporis]EEB19199.1 conserved hypothetical protein [Pediculus humanus corporis]